MPASSALSIDEFAALVAATFSNIDVCDQASAGGNSHINSVDGQLQERPKTPPPTSISVKRPSLSNWRRKKPTFESCSTSSARFCGSTTDSFLDSQHHSIEYGDSGIATTSQNIRNYLNIRSRKQQATRMTACEPTILAASMSTVDFGNCLSLSGGRCGSGSYAGTSSSSRNSANPVYNRNTGGTVSTVYTNANATPTIPVFTLEVDDDASFRRSSDVPIDLGPTVIGLSSSLRLPRTPSPLFRKSVPDLRIQDPSRNRGLQQPESPRTPRKSFFSKLKKQLSSKSATTSDSHLPITSTSPLPTTSHSDGSPTGLFKLHLSLPLTPLSLSTPASPDPSRSPSPRFPFRAISASYKRESAPPTTNVVLENPPSTCNRSPNLSPIDRPDFRSGDEWKKRIHSLHGYNYSLAYSDKDSSPLGPIESQEQPLEHGKQRIESNRRSRSDSILSLSDCLVEESGKVGTQMNWMMGEPKKRSRNKTNSGSKGGIKEYPGRSSQPFPTYSQPDSDEVLSVPSKYSCESAPRSVRMSLSTRIGTINDAISNANEVVFPVGRESVPGSASLVQLPTQTSLPAVSRNHHHPEEEPPSYAPFVPLVFQHERLQQKLQKSVPLISMPAEEIEKVTCIKSVALKPFPPRTSSLSSAIHVRQRTKSAPDAPHDKSKPKYHPATPPIPMLSPLLTPVLTTVRNQPGASMPPSKKDRKSERPATAPANSTPNLTIPFKARGGVIPFPVVKEAIGEEHAKKSLLSPSRSSASTQPAELPSPIQSIANTNELSNSHGEGDSGSRTGSVGLNYSLSLSKHPYAQARSSEGMSPTPEETDAKAEATRNSKASVTFVPSTTTDGESRRLQSQTQTQRRFKVAQNLMPLSPTSPTSNSGSGSGSDVSTKSPVTPRSPMFWNVSGAGIAAAVKSRIGLGIPTSGSEEGHISAERKAYRDSAINLDGISAIGTSGDASKIKKEYTPPHPYSRSYSTTGLQDTPSTEETSRNTVNDQFPRPSAIDDEPTSSIRHRPSMQTMSHHGIAPSKPPPIGPLPFLPDTVKSGSERYQVGDNLSAEVPPSPVPSEYTRAFSNPSARRGNDDDDDFDSPPFTAPSYTPSQSSESYGHDPEYEALLAANTRANVGELASMRNIGVGRRLMSGHPQPPTCIDPTPSRNEGKRKRVYSEAARHPGMGGEWTLFLGNDDTPPRREEIIAELNSVPMTGIKTLSGVRARTKSESALKSLGLGHKKSCSMKRARSSNLAPCSSSRAPLSSLPPVPRLVKKQIPISDDWTLSLPLLPPGEKDSRELSTTDADLSATMPVSDPISLIRGATSPAQYLEPGDVGMGAGFDSDEGDDMTIAESQIADAPFVLDIDSLDLDDDDSLLDFSVNSASDRAPNFDHLLFSVPRVVSKGSGMESAKWGEEVDEKIIKKKGRRLSDGLDSLLGVRVDVNEDGESVCIVDGLSLNTEEVENGSDEGCRMEGLEFADSDVSDATKENLARLDALSADLKRFNELLKEGVSTTTAVGLKHARSCGLLPSQTEVKSDHLRVQQSLDTLRDADTNSESTKPTLEVTVKDRVKSWTERSVSGPPTGPVSSSQNSPPTPPMALKSRPPLPFAPSSPPRYARPLGRNAALGIGPIAPSPGRSAIGRAMTMTTQTKPSHLKVVPAIAAAIPDGVVGSGLKVGGNGRVISLSCSSAAAPVVASTQAGLLRVITNETKDKKAPATVQQSKNDEESEGNWNDSVLERDTKRNSASSFTSIDSFFTSFSAQSQAHTPPLNKDTSSSRSRQVSASSDYGSTSTSPTPTATSPPGLRIITSSTTNSTRAHSPVDDVNTPSSSALPTPLASSFPTVPALPSALSSLGEDLKTVSKMLAGTWRSKNKTTKKAEDPVNRRHHEKESVASRLSSASDMSVRTIVPEQQASQGSSKAPLHSTAEGEPDTESTYSDSFYSARSSFEGIMIDT